MAKHAREETERIGRDVLTADDAFDSVTEIIREALRRDILSLALPPGSPLRLRCLRLRYHVGATPIREALWSLVGDGLVETEPQRGFRVAATTRERLSSLKMLRLRIEPDALAASMQRADAAWRRDVEDAFTAFQPFDSRVGDLRPIDVEWERRHAGFHLSLLQRCGLPSVLQLLTGWYQATNRYRRLASSNLGATAATKPDHEALFLAARAGNVDLAVAILRRHIEDTLTRHMGYFDDPVS